MRTFALIWLLGAAVAVEQSAAAFEQSAAAVEQSAAAVEQSAAAALRSKGTADEEGAGGPRASKEAASAGIVVAGNIVADEIEGRGVVHADRRLLGTEPYSYTYEYDDGRTKEIRTCIGCYETKGYDDRNDCPDGFNLWVPEDYDEANEVRNEWLPTMRTNSWPDGLSWLVQLVGVFKKKDGKYNDGPMNSDSYDSINGNYWESVAWLKKGEEDKVRPWFLRNDKYGDSGDPFSGNYDKGCWLSTNYKGDDANCRAGEQSDGKDSRCWVDGKGFRFDDDFCKYSGGRMDRFNTDDWPIGYLCEACPAGRSKLQCEYGQGVGDKNDDDCDDNYYCKRCEPGTYSGPGAGSCEVCSEGKYASGGVSEGTYAGQESTECSNCTAGKSSPAKTASSSDCDFCDDGYISDGGDECRKCPAGTTSNSGDYENSEDLHTECVSCKSGSISGEGERCRTCPAGETSNSDHTECISCDDGYISDEGDVCRPCDAGKSSNGQHTECEDCDKGYFSQKGKECEKCPAGSYSDAEGTAYACPLCDPGKYSDTSGATECTKCGDGDDVDGKNPWQEAWDNGWWKKTEDQKGLTGDVCACAGDRPRTGTNCDREACEATTPVVSLGFLVLEVQWPRFARTLSTNEDFVGISGAFISFDANDDNYLSVDEAKRALRDGNMSVPKDLSHIWSEGSDKLYQGQVTITKMVQDELARLADQGTKEYYDQPSGSGAIAPMEATYPNNHDGDKWNNDICGPDTVNSEGMLGKPPKLTWTVDRKDKDRVIYQQCVFFNGVALSGEDTGAYRTITDGKSNVDDKDCRGQRDTECKFKFQRPESIRVVSKHSYCVETKFCKEDTDCKEEGDVNSDLTILRCTTGLQYDGRPMDVFPKLLGTQGVALSWLDTSTVATGYRVYKVADVTVPFAEDTSARLLREVQMRAPDCGLTHDYVDFRDITTGSQPGLYVGYAVVPLDDDGVEDKKKVGENGFYVTWFGDVYIEVEAEGGGPVKDAILKLSHLEENGKLDPSYTDFVEAVSDEYGEALLPIRVQDPNWIGLTQRFRVTIEKTSTKANGDPLVHEFEPAFEDATVRHLFQGTYAFTDMTSRVISGTVSHDAFGAAYFAENCPHTKSEDPSECMCPVDGAKVFIIRASGREEEVVLNDGKFATAVYEGETVTIGLKMYNGTNSVVPHSFSITHDAGDVETVVEGTEPTFRYTANDDAEVHFLDISRQTLSATYVVGADRAAAEYVNGLPVVAKVERCGWERPAWALRGVASFELGATAGIEVRALGDDEVLEGKYYLPPGGFSEKVDCDSLDKSETVEGVPLGGDERMIRGCRLKIPDVSASATERRPCAVMDYDYVDQLPKIRNFDVDLSILGSTTTNGNAQAPVEFLIASPLCLKEVTAAAASGTTLQSLLTDDGERNREFFLEREEDLLLSPPDDFTPPEGTDLYGKACTDNFNAVFREGDAVHFGFLLVEREPECFESGGLWPWDDVAFGGTACSGYKDTPPSPDLPIAIRVADGVSRTESGATYGDEPFEHIMTAGDPNPFAPFSHELSVEFTRPFDRAEILFLRHAIVVGVIPEEVPQVWTVATNPTLIFLILYDPPGGGSFAALTEGSTISTSMSIDGSHAAELEDEFTLGASLGGGVSGVKAQISPLGIGIEKTLLTVGGKGGLSYSQTPVDVTVKHASSRHFDVGISFSTGISTSSSPYLAGQPSDVIVGGGANIRFMESIKVVAKVDPPGADPQGANGLCIGGETTKEFLPEQVSTWVMSVYEIEKTMERIGAALADPNITKLENADESSTYDPRTDLEKQLENWQTVLANYRAAKTRDQTLSVAEQLSRELEQFQETFEGFLAEAKEGKDGAFENFLVDGLDKLDGSRINEKTVALGAVTGLAFGPVGVAVGAGVGAAIGAASSAAGKAQLKRYDSKNEGNVNRAARECVSAATLADPSGDHRLCDVYDDISKKLELRESLFGICDFKDGNPSVEAFCKRDHYRSDDPESKETGAFDALHDTTQFITFSGSTGLEFSWDISESKGAELTSSHDATVADSFGGSFGFGADIGRRRLESADDRGVPGYAYPISGEVLAVSKKLLEVTPEALEEKRRRLYVISQFEGHESSIAKAANTINQHAAAAANVDNAKTTAKVAGNPCRRRLDGVELSDEERRLGITMCTDFQGGGSSSFAVSLGRAAKKDAEHTRSVSISLGDGNAQDVFAVKISQDTVYGTPIFTTMGGRSSCVGETGTTRRDSRVTIEQIKPLCSGNDPADFGRPRCASTFDCECKDLAPGENAIFSVLLQNLSPWDTSVRYLLRAVNGGSTPWDSGKYFRDFTNTSKVGCEPGELGSLGINAYGITPGDLRNDNGLQYNYLPWGQHEVRIRVSRPDFAPQCFSFEDLELEIVSACEDTDWDGVQEVYQYRTSMDAETGDVTVIHPKFVGRPVGSCDVATEDLTPAELPDGSDAKNQGTGRWCYSDLNLAVGCSASPKSCWEMCSDKVADLKGLEGTAAEVVATCPASFVKAVDDMFKCDVGELKAIDWEEETGQCRCQNSCDLRGNQPVRRVHQFFTKSFLGDDAAILARSSGCDCAVNNLVMPDGEKRTTTHLLTKDVDFPPKDKKNGELSICGLYTFKDDTRARGTEQSKATFDVSWNNEVRGCKYELAANFDPRATKDDGSCIFPILGCTYAAAENYDPEATVDDDSCEFGSQFVFRDVEGGFCMSGVVQSEALIALITDAITKLAGVDPAFVDVTVDASAVSSCGGTRRRLLSGDSLQIDYSIRTNPVDTAKVEANMAGVTAAMFDATLRDLAGLSAEDILGDGVTEDVQEVTMTVTTPVPTPAPSAVPTQEPTTDPRCDGYCGSSKDGGKCGKGHTNCAAIDPPYTASDLGYGIKLDPTTGAKKTEECWTGKGYDRAYWCGAKDQYCNGEGAEWLWCEKEEIDYCEGSCFMTGGKGSKGKGKGKKNDGGYHEGESYCRRKSTMQCYVDIDEDDCESWDDYVWCPQAPSRNRRRLRGPGVEQE